MSCIFRYINFISCIFSRPAILRPAVYSNIFASCIFASFNTVFRCNVLHFSSCCSASAKWGVYILLRILQTDDEDDDENDDDDLKDGKW